MDVYILQCKIDPRQEYIGLTTNLKHGFGEHDRGEQSHTVKFRPWKIKMAIWVDSKEKAVNLERYLKSDAGRAFRSKHF